MEPTPSHAFGVLHERLQRWIWQRNWTELRDAQERAIPIIVAAERDVVIAATTASGKTEAAFLPIASRLMEDQGEGLALYISPLKALINDQCLRLEELFGVCELPVHPWHGDIAGSKKSGFEENPRGALLITPESLESIFVRKGFYVPSIFRLLQFVVVDELHSFINTERGMQLSSLLHRLEAALGRRVPRIGLSATLGDMSLAAEFLRPGEGVAVQLIESCSQGREIRILVKGYREQIVGNDTVDSENDEPEGEGVLAALQISRDLFKSLRASKNLVFANSRRRVEEFTDRLCRLCEDQRFPNEFYAHHGSLSKGLREEVEGRREFSRHGLGAEHLIASQEGTIVFLWAGDVVTHTLLVHLQSLGFTGMSFGIGLVVEDITPELLRKRLEELVQAGPADPVVLSDSVPNRVTDRYDCFLPPDLLSENYASGALDSTGEWNAIRDLLIDKVNDVATS